MLQSLIKTYLVTLLKEHGFKKSNITWNRNSVEVTHVINTQKSRFNEKYYIRFTLNVGMWMQPVWSIYHNLEIPKFISINNCFPDFRLGELLYDFSKVRDKWWLITNVDDVKVVGEELYNALAQKCIPFLDQFKLMSDVKTFVDKNKVSLCMFPYSKLCYAILSHILGDTETCEQILNEFEVKKMDYWKKDIDGIKSRLKIPGK